MRKHILTIVVLLPLLLSVAHAGQSWSVAPPVIGWGYPSEDAGMGGYLGVDIADISTDRLDALKLKEEAGVEITMVDQDAPAGKAGIKEHDVILTMNGTAIESKAQLQRMIHETPAGRLITLGISRDGQPVTIKLQLADRSHEFPHMAKSKDFHVEIPPIPNLPDFEMPSFVVVHSSVRSGLMVENITAQLGDFFGVKNGNGVLVRSVEKGSRGEKAGLRAGDVIVRVGDRFIHDTGDFTEALRSRSNNTVPLSVIRDKKTQTLTLTLPARHESGEMKQSLEREDPDVAAQEEATTLAEEEAQLRPEMELASRDLERAATQAAQAQCKALQSKQGKLRKQLEKLQQELQPQAEEELERGAERLQQEMQELQDKLQADGLDI
jgi:membrane-associated protease RseP (regulator of RpoE activity)